MGHPVWVDDPQFSVTRHVSVRRADPPGDDHALARVVGEIASTPLPRDRPLWSATLVTGLADGRIAAVAKVHHAVADGAATVEMLRRVLDDGSATQAPGPRRSAPAAVEPIPDPAALAGIAATARAAKVRAVPRVAIASVRNTATTAWRRQRAPLRAAKPFDGPRTSLNVSLTAERTFAMTTLPLTRLLAVRRALHGTLNDAYLTICAGALRAYFLARGEPVGRALVASVPIGIPGDDPSRISGNRVDNMYVRIPVHLADPVLRFRAVHDDVVAARALREVMDPALVAERAELTPTHLYPLAMRALAASKAADRLTPPINLVISNVAGPRDELHLGGTRLEAIFSVGPILEGVGLNLTAWSYAGGLHIAAIGCPRSVPDPWALVDRLPEELAALEAAVSIPSGLNPNHGEVSHGS
jgi:WS/DGAT/MGAT family acyltransferase